VCGHVYAPTAGCCTADADCNDTDSCTLDTCIAGNCSNDEICCSDDADCDDADACTLDVCSETSLLDVIDIVGNDVSVTCEPATALSYDASSQYFGFTSNMLNWTHNYTIPSGQISSASLTIDAGDLDSGVLEVRASDGTPLGTIAGGENGSPGPFVCPSEWDGTGNDVVMTIPPSLYPDLMDGDFSAYTVLQSGSVGAYGTNRAMLMIDVFHAECTNAALDCDDNNACTTDSCDPALGCVNDVTSGIGDPCDDNVGCTIGDACDASGACVPGLQDDDWCDDLDPCTADVCDPSDPGSDPATGCISSLTPGVACDDGNACTTNDQCGPSVIRSLIGTDTDPLYPDGPCPLETSLTAVYGAATEWPGFASEMVSWTHTYAPFAAPVISATLTIDIGDADSGVLQLQASDGTPIGTIAGGDNGAPGPFLCPWQWDSYSGDPDGNDIVLTIPSSLYPDLMDGSFYIETVQIASVGGYGINRAILDVEIGGSCGGESVDCDDGNACNGPETCDPGDGCQAGTEPPDCDDLNTCTDDSCDPGMGCLHTPNDANSCDDSNVCNGAELCSAGTCAPGSPLICDDGDACNGVETCDPTLGCQPGSGPVCDDGDSCTTDGCDAGSCTHAPSGECGISGTVRYYRDYVGSVEPSSKPVPNVDIDVASDGVENATTDPAGSYAVGDLFGSFAVTTLDKLGQPRASDHNDAITSTDAAVISQARVGLLTLSTNQQVAADVSGNGSVTSFDASLVAQFAVEHIDHFDVALAMDSDWAFYRCDNYVSESNHDCTSPVHSHDPLSGTVQDDFYAILYGDVTGNWQPAGGRAAQDKSDDDSQIMSDQEQAIGSRRMARDRQLRRDAGPVVLSYRANRAAISAGSQRTVFLGIRNGNGIQSLDIDLQYDTDRVSIAGIEVGEAGVGLTTVSNDLGGVIKIGMYGLLATERSGTLLAITFEARQDIDRPVVLGISAEVNEGRIPLRFAGWPRSLRSGRLDRQPRIRTQPRD
jgi:hypothetical protein